MGTSLTPEFWRLFAVLLVIATAVTFVLSATLDALVLRWQRHRASQRPSGMGTGTGTGAAMAGPVRPQRRSALHAGVKG
jgi:hypothetical protein